MVKYYCVSDIHSFYDELIEALEAKKFNINDPDMRLIICGDAFDRGNQSREVFDFLKKLASQNRLIYVLGNHEDLLFECLTEISYQDIPGMHHFSNGTIKTICDICDVDKGIIFDLKNEDNVKLLFNKTEELRTFIRDQGRDYFTLGDKIFVHSWLPCYFDQLYENWESLEPNSSMWRHARWGNPFDQWELGIYPKDKTIVFGHWHCSTYWARKDPNKWEEFPSCESKLYAKECFKPAIDKGIIGLDACTAFTGFVNCVVFDENGKLLEC